MKMAELVYEVGRGQVMSLPFPLAPHQRRVVTLHPVHSWRSDLLHDTFFPRAASTVAACTLLLLCFGNYSHGKLGSPSTGKASLEAAGVAPVSV